MFKLIKLTEEKFVVAHSRAEMYWTGDNMNALFNIMSDLGVDYMEVVAALENMELTSNNCADFGEVRGTFLYAERKTIKEIDALIPGEIKEQRAC